MTLQSRPCILYANHPSDTEYPGDKIGSSSPKTRLGHSAGTSSSSSPSFASSLSSSRNLVDGKLQIFRTATG